MDREQMQRCLEVVAAYRASAQKSKVWVEANGVPERSLASWCAHSRRWQARLDGVSAGSASRPSGFVAAHVRPCAASATVRIQMTCGGTRIDLHRPLAPTRELAALMRQLSQ